MIRVLQLGDALTQAQSIAASGGYKATCTQTRVSLPFVDPNTGLNYYYNNECTIPGDARQFDAGLIDQSPSVFLYEASHPYKPAPNPTPVTYQQSDPPPAATTPVYVPPIVPVPPTPAPPPATTPTAPATPAAPPAGYNFWTDPANPFLIALKTPAPAPTPTPATGSSTTVTTTDGTAAGYDTQGNTGFWQQPLVQSVTTTAASFPWWIWLVVAVAGYQFTKGKR